MDKDRFIAILPLIVGGLVNKVVDKTGISEDEAFDALYNSELYVKLENEKTKLWTFSIPMLLELFQEEKTTGILTFPEC